MMQLKSLYHEPNGDLGLLIGIFIIGSFFSTLDYATLKTAITGATDLDMYWISAAFALFIGACGKSAQIPLYTWLCDGRSYSCFSINMLQQWLLQVSL
jgi:NADH:ubiquinone oxidoreductase subunit 5 (subunit L)/multisubunit Na+/H+ antiporter MnhA subunit